ncbi:hypothetical protein F5Y02DRAFT_402765 [Annulohypoxylon stygium]|nr:hypothetical protein F5Y02DRAFT_402765 [Annulohypoxylon stygium]
MHLPYEILNKILLNVIGDEDYKWAARLRSVNRQWNAVAERIIFEKRLLENRDTRAAIRRDKLKTYRQWQRYMAYRVLHNRKPFSPPLRLIRCTAEFIVKRRWGSVWKNWAKLVECVNVICHNRYIFEEFRCRIEFFNGFRDLGDGTSISPLVKFMLDRFTSVVLSSTDDRISQLTDELYRQPLLQRPK